MAKATVTKVKTTTGEDQPLKLCYTYRQHNIVVRDCPDVFYDREGWILDDSRLDVRSDNTYMGYYPKPDETNVPKPVVPENEDQDNQSKSTSSGDNLCFWNCD